VQGQNKHTHIFLFFRFQVSWLLCFCCLCVGLQPCSNCKCVGISMIGWVLGGSWMCWLLVCWSVCPSVCVCVLLPASVELKDYWLQSFRVACMYVWKFRACWCPIWITNQMVKFVSLIWSEQKTSMPNAHILGFFFWCVKFWFPSARVKIQHLLITSWISDSEANSFHIIDPVIYTLMLVLVTSFICCF
jgi:hypothetical protein